RFAMGDTEAVEVAGLRRPGAHPGAGPRLHEIDGREAAEVMALAIAWKIPLVGTPAHLARLRAFADKAVDRPGVDELARLLGHVRDLAIALGDVDDLYPELA